MISKTFLRNLLVAGIVGVTTACTTTQNQSSEPTEQPVGDVNPVEASGLKVVTWNVEHLAYPITEGCKPRSADEMAKLKAYASSLDADIVALQEVDSEEAVAQLFPAENWQIIMSERPDNEPYTCRRTGFTSTQQKVAYAVRKSINVESVDSLEKFGLGNPGLRHGLELQVNSEEGSFALLNLHMKSGCFVDNYSRADSDACQTFAKQAPLLDQWIETKEAEGTPYIVLGDFNHRLSAPYNHLTRQLVSNSDGSDSSLTITTAPMIGCHPYYPAPIDHILVGNLPEDMHYQPAGYHAFDDMTPDAMLSDHCAVSVEIAAKKLPLSRAVEWQTISKEYRYLTANAYAQAEKTLSELSPSAESWVVVMDIDETVLDNSAYQVTRDQTGTSFSLPTWAAWVKSEKATLVPGVKSFIEKVLASGGKLALVTNRERALDEYTWRNMLSLGLPVSLKNTCLIGRASEDKSAIDGKLIINDKDLRRQQVESGAASCFNPGGGRHKNFGKHQIVMQVGDNIEDFAGVTQEHADTTRLVADSNGTLVLLPNPMYGSWR